MSDRTAAVTPPKAASKGPTTGTMANGAATAKADATAPPSPLIAPAIPASLSLRSVRPCTSVPSIVSMAPNTASVNGLAIALIRGAAINDAIIPGNPVNTPLRSLGAVVFKLLNTFLIPEIFALASSFGSPPIPRGKN